MLAGGGVRLPGRGKGDPRPPPVTRPLYPSCPAVMLAGGADTLQERAMGLLDILNGMQNGPRGQSTPSAQDSGGMSPITMAILALLAYKAVKHIGGGQPNAAPAPAPSPVDAGLPGGGMGGGLGDLLKGG